MTLRFEHADGSSETVDELAAELDESLHEAAVFRAWIERGDANGITIAPDDDEVFYQPPGSSSDRFGGPLRESKRTADGQVEILVDSFEQYAARSEPSAPNDTFTDTDDKTIVEGAIGGGGALPGVAQLSAGTIEQTATGITYQFNHKTAAEIIRDVRMAAGADVIYQADKTVDYVASRGSDHTATTLSPANSSFEGFDAADDSGLERITHLRVLGDGRGKTQTEVNVVPADDGSSYTNKRTYTNGDWASGDPETWAIYTDRSVSDVDTLATIGQTIIGERQDAHQEITLSVKGTEIRAGDEFTIDYPEENITSQVLRCVELTTTWSEAGITYEATFSTLEVSRLSVSGKDRIDIERYNQGDVTVDSLPIFDTTSNAPQVDGYTILVTGDGADAEGVYRYSSADGQYNKLTTAQLAELASNGVLDLDGNNLEDSTESKQLWDVTTARPTSYLRDGIYGDASDGSFAGTQTLSGLVFADEVTVGSGETLTLNSQVGVIHATLGVKVDGTLESVGQGASGGAGGTGGSTGGSGNGGDGSPGNDAAYSATDGFGGTGGDAGGGTGGGGGDGGNVDTSLRENLTALRQVLSVEYDDLYRLNRFAGAGGGGGGGGAAGGSDADDGPGGDGGDGGAGGGVVVVIAPEIRGSGTIQAVGGAGADGDPGSDGGSASTDGGGGGGGGGEGGSGGAVILVSSDISPDLTVQAPGGSGGAGGAGGTGGGGDGQDGDPGDAGTAGITREITPFG